MTKGLPPLSSRAIRHVSDRPGGQLARREGMLYLVTYILYVWRIVPAVFMTSMIYDRNCWKQKGKLAVLLSRLLNVDLWQPGLKIDWKNVGHLFCIPFL